ncbi:MAG: DUF3501 family protein [Gammaproteobacteria bacterium]|nr:DUF3501 family protein [Gammaproteobacteria bacterium]
MESESVDKLQVGDLLKLEEYAGRRGEFRARVLRHKKNRKLHIGAHLTLLFEDRLTIQYQIQEMLRIERIFERGAIEGELAVYNPLIPDGGNWKASCLIEYPELEERQRRLAELKGIEDSIWVRIGDGEKIVAVADEDLERGNQAKTSAVHFLRFELPPPAIAALRTGATVHFGVDHPGYRHSAEAPEPVRAALLADLDG